MRIAILIDTLQFGGAEKQAVSDANALSLSGHDVILVYFQDGPLRNELNSKVAVTKIKAVEYLGRIREVAAVMRAKRSEVVHAHMFRAALIGSIAGRISRVPVVLNEHGLGLWRSLRHRVLFRLAAILASETWCASEACRSIRIHREGLHSSRTRTLYNGFAPWEQTRNLDDFRASVLTKLPQVKQSAVVVGFVGRFDPVKRLELLVDIAAKLNYLELVFVVVGDGITRKSLELQVQDKGLGGRFHFPGFVHNPREYYGIFDIFVLPSKRESMSMALLEAGGCGVPSVVFDVGGNAEIVVNEKTGLVVKDKDIQCFAAAVERLAIDPMMRKNLGSQAVERIRTLFSPQRRIENILEGYQRVARR